MATHDSFEAAREQAAEYLGFAASERITTRDGVFEIPNPSLLDDDQQEQVDALDIEMDGWDRYPDALNDDGSVKTRGALKLPYRTKDGQPALYNVRLAKAIFGERFDAFKAAGGQSSDVQLIWSKMRRELEERLAADSKSAGSGEAVAAVPEPDSL
ncbi:hypothetical protein AWC11_07310 [Mycobacterium interjectum]|nr:hypothetical protein AWC11_07310 [Mycobacterium interjectum]